MKNRPNSHAVLHRPLPDIDEIPPLGEADNECIEELRNVLEKHGAITRFGVFLLHDHFHIGEDEKLVEFCDKENRTLTIRPVKKQTLTGRKLIETSWRLDTKKSTLGCVLACYSDSQGHSQQHTPTTAGEEVRSA